ncbi:hypothetical protein OH77DRAFT_171101 [Trametes cingulata]|nr:hypothetical protein OH77DRAFT_171101 [Trametes cingulata]
MDALCQAMRWSPSELLAVVNLWVEQCRDISERMDGDNAGDVDGGDFGAQARALVAQRPSMVPEAVAVHPAHPSPLPPSYRTSTDTEDPRTIDGAEPEPIAHTETTEPAGGPSTPASTTPPSDAEHLLTVNRAPSQSVAHSESPEAGAQEGPPDVPSPRCDEDGAPTHQSALPSAPSDLPAVAMTSDGELSGSGGVCAGGDADGASARGGHKRKRGKGRRPKTLKRPSGTAGVLMATTEPTTLAARRPAREGRKSAKGPGLDPCLTLAERAALQVSPDGTSRTESTSGAGEKPAGKRKRAGAA